MIIIGNIIYIFNFLFSNSFLYIRRKKGFLCGFTHFFFFFFFFVLFQHLPLLTRVSPTIRVGKLHLNVKERHLLFLLERSRCVSNPRFFLQFIHAFGRSCLWRTALGSTGSATGISILGSLLGLGLGFAFATANNHPFFFGAEVESFSPFQRQKLLIHHIFFRVFLVIRQEYQRVFRTLQHEFRSFEMRFFFFFETLTFQTEPSSATSFLKVFLRRPRESCAEVSSCNLS